MARYFATPCRTSLGILKKGISRDEKEEKRNRERERMHENIVKREQNRLESKTNGFLIFKCLFLIFVALEVPTSINQLISPNPLANLSVRKFKNIAVKTTLLPIQSKSISTQTFLKTIDFSFQTTNKTREIGTQTDISLSKSDKKLADLSKKHRNALQNVRRIRKSNKKRTHQIWI